MPTLLNVFWQVLHLQGRSPVWPLMCLISFELQGNPLPQLEFISNQLCNTCGGMVEIGEVYSSHVVFFKTVFFCSKVNTAIYTQKLPTKKLIDNLSK